MLRTVMLLCCIFTFLCGCSDANKNKENQPYAVVMCQDKNENMFIMNKQMKIVQKKKIGQFVIDAEVFGGYLFALDAGLPESLKKDLYKVNLSNIEDQSIVNLPYAADRIYIFDKKAYLLSGDETQQGFPLMIVDLDTMKVVNTVTTPGLPTTVVKSNENIDVFVNSGGPNKFGDQAKLIQIDPKTNDIKAKIETGQELPPSSVVAQNQEIWSVYPGFPSGKYPRWVKNGKDYTNKIKLLDDQARPKEVFDLDVDLPQQITIKDDNAYINHFDIDDLKGDTVTVFNLTNKKVTDKIKVNSPSYVAADNQNLWIANYNEGTVTIMNPKDKKIEKTIKVGQWPAKIFLVKDV